jgi:acyl carrier protein
MDEPFLNKLRELNQGNIDDAAAIEPESWDSVELLDLIAAIDESYDVTVPVERLKACRTVGDLRQLILAETSAS